MSEVIGAPPTLEWVAVERLKISDVYQRSTDGHKSSILIARMAKTWDWRLCQPLAVSRRADGDLYVIDGQHRLTAAKRSGLIPHLPCVILPSEGDAAEAAIFVSLNNQRQKLNQGDIFKAAIASGHPESVKALELIERAGLSLAPHANYVSWKPGQIFCGPAIAKLIKLHGEVVVSSALVAFSEAFGGQILSIAPRFIAALCEIYKSPPEGFDCDAFIEAMSSIPIREWGEEAADKRKDSGLNIRDSFVEVLLAEYRSLIKDRVLAA